ADGRAGRTRRSAAWPADAALHRSAWQRQGGTHLRRVEGRDALPPPPARQGRSDRRSARGLDRAALAESPPAHGGRRRMNTVTRLLAAYRAGDPGAFDRLVPLVYDDLRRLARARVRRLPRGGTIDTTALV